MATKRPDRYQVTDTDADGRPSGISYPPDKRAEPGDVVDDLPQSATPWLLKQGLIRKAEPRKRSARTKGKS